MTSSRRRTLVILAVVAIVAGVFGVWAWVRDDTPVVEVRLSEYRVQLDPTDLGPGPTRFEVTNEGARAHELVVVRSRDVRSLLRNVAGGIFEDEIEAEDLGGAIARIRPGARAETTIDLRPGNYVAFCNLSHSVDGRVVAHFRRGMHAVIHVR